MFGIRAVGISRLTSIAAAVAAYTKSLVLSLKGDSAYNKNQNTTILDRSQNDLVVTRGGDAAQTVSSFSPFSSGASYYFDGSGDYLTVPSSTAFGFGTGDFTIEAWVYLTKTPSAQWQEIISLNPGNFVIYADSNTGALSLYSMPSVGIVGSTYNIPLNRWVHIAVARQSGTIKAYADGIQVISTASTVNIQSTTAYIGALYTGNEYWTGYISNLRIVKGTALYTANFTPPTTALTAVSGTSLLTCHSSRLFDASSTAADISVFGNTTASTFSPFDKTALSGTVGGTSVYFDGNGDYLSWAGTTLAADFTIECWFYQTAKSAQYVPIISGTTGTYNFPLILDYTASGRVGFYLADAVAGNSGTSTFTLNSWNHVALTRSGSSVRLFLNGSQVASGTSSASVVINTIGGWTGAAGYLLFGNISNARVVNGTALYTGSFTPPTTALTAVSGTSLLTLQDSSFRDNSSNAFAITKSGDVTSYSISPFAATSNWSGYFDGSGDYLSIANTTALDLPGDFTIELWWNPTSLSGTQSLFGKWANVSGNPQYAWLVQVTSSTITLHTNSTASGSITSISNPWSPTVGQWYHLAFTRSGTDVKTYVNGTQVGTTQTSSRTCSSTAATGIGANMEGPQQYTSGYISNARVVKGTALYTANFTPASSPLTAVSGTSLLTLQDSTFKDNSSNAFALTKAGDTEIRKVGPFGAPNVWSGYFDGTGDYLSVPSNAALAFGTGDFTVECWIYMSAPSDSPIYEGRTNSANTTGFTITAFSSSVIRIFCGSVLISSSGTNYINRWTHVAVSRLSGTTTLYVNGISAGTTSSLGNLTDSEAVIGGGRYAGGTSVSSYFPGYISNFRIVKGTALYTAAFTPSIVPLTAISGTSLLTLQNSTFKDNSSNAFTITRAGDAAVREVGPFNQTASVSGYFDGTGDYLTVADATALRFMSTDYTVEAWIYPTTLPSSATYGGPIITNTTNGSNGWELRYTNSSRMALVYPGIVANSFGAAGSVPVGAWTHVAIVKSGSTVKGYINGVEYSITSSSPAETNGAWIIGYGLIAYFTGYISNVRIVKGTAVYTGSFTPSTTPLTAISGTSLLTLQGSTFTDNSSNAFTVTKFGDVKMLPGAPFIEAGVWSSYFDGVGDYLTMPTGSLDFMHQGAASWTFDTWFYSTTAATEQTLLSTTGSTLQTGFMILVPTTGSVAIQIARSSSGNSYICATPTGIVARNSWNHVAITFNGTSKAISIYLNGAAQATTTTGTATFSAATATYAPDIGRFMTVSVGAGGYFTGYMSNMRVVQGSILYSGNFTPSTSGLTAVSGTSLLTCDGAAISDSSTNNATVTVAGNTKISSLNPFGSGSGWSGYFDGAGDYLSIPSNAAFAFGTGDFTVEMWFNTSNATTRHDPLSVYTSTTGFGFALSFDNAGDVLFYNGDTQLINTSGSQWSANTWNHLAVSRSGTALRMFLNGAQIGSVTNSTNFTIASSLYIGIAGNVTLPYTGYLSNVRIVKGTALYTTAFTPSTSPLTAVSGTSLLTLQDNTFKDNSSNAFTITQAGDAAIRAVGPFGAGNVWSGYFDGTGDYLTVTDATAFNLTSVDFTIEAWVNIPSFSQTQQGLCNFAPHNTIGISLNRTGVGDVYVYLGNGSSWLATPSINSNAQGRNLTTGTWNHIALVRNGSSVTLYINGQSAGTTANLPSGMTGGLYIGTIWLGSAIEPMNGYISNFRVVKGTALYTSAFTPAASPLTTVSGTSLLTLQDSTFKDNSSNAFTLTRGGDARTVAEGPFAVTFPAATAVFPGSIYFDGANDYLTIPSSAAMNVLGGDLTIECWFNPTSFNASNYNYLIMQDDGGSDSQNFQLTCSAAGLAGFTTWNTSARASAFGLTSVRAVKLGAWNHIAVTHVKSTNTTRLFLNGVLEATSTTAMWAGSTQPTCIGNWNNGLGIQNSTYSKLNGYLSGVRLIKGSAVYTAAFTPPTAPPAVTAGTALLLNFNDGGIVDGYGTNSSSTFTNSGAVTNNVTKKYGSGSLFFNNNYLLSPQKPEYAFGTGDFTIQFWVNPASQSASLGIMQITSTAPSSFAPTNEGVGIVLANGSAPFTLNFFIGGAAQTGTIGLTTGAWTHVALCRSAGTVRLFVGGVLSKSVASSANLTGQYLTVGAANGLLYGLPCYLDNIEIHKGYAKYTTGTTFTPE